MMIHKKISCNVMQLLDRKFNWKKIISKKKTGSKKVVFVKLCTILEYHEER